MEHRGEYKEIMLDVWDKYFKFAFVIKSSVWYRVGKIVQNYDDFDKFSVNGLPYNSYNLI